MVKILVMIFFFVNIAQAAPREMQYITMDLQNVEIQDALHLLGRFFHQNILLSPKVHGNTALYLHHVTQEEALNLLLISHGLVKTKIGETWFIAPREEFAKQLEEESKQRQLKEEANPLLTYMWRMQYAKAEDLAHLLEESNHSLLSKRGKVKVDSRTNTLYVEETEENLSKIKGIIKRLDVPVDQVLIEARLISIDQDFERQLGLHFDNQSSTEKLPGRYSLAMAKLANGSPLDIQLTALEQEGHGEIISTPSLFASNQQPALIEAGEEIPYQEVSRSGGTAITFKKAVLSLKVTPQILPDHKMLLQLQVNQDRPSNRVVLGVPAITTRQISTQILVANAQTIVLGGIYEGNQEQSTQRVPFLGKIPLVGVLFRQHNVKENKRELLIFVTPTIISFSNKTEGPA